MAESADREGWQYRDFWARVGAKFPDLGGAASTRYYADNEERLFREFLEPLTGRRVFKTDLWDEARNTRILQWASERGARAFGLDLSPATTRMARAEFESIDQKLAAAVSDIRWVPFADQSFDAIYSMGTIEHFDETEQAIAEIFRVLKAGGRAVIGVPNRRDPFLRPLMVWVLYRLGLYGYGFEKSYSRANLRRMLEGAGFDVIAESGILFIPGWLRMLDLALHAWCRPLARITGLAVKPFAWLYRKFPGVRRHGYLIAAVVIRP
ncbi:MAG: class I SAM-dependent methyltransferase [Thermoanaerobaculia bacterium]